MVNGSELFSSQSDSNNLRKCCYLGGEEGEIFPIKDKRQGFFSITRGLK